MRSAAVAVDHARVGKVSAKLALMAVLGGSLSIEHDPRDQVHLRVVAVWREALLFIFQQLLNVDPILPLNCQPIFVRFRQGLNACLV